MATGLGLLGLAPLVFWAMTPRELSAMLRGRLGLGTGEGALSRSAFDRLMQRFPDGTGM